MGSKFWGVGLLLASLSPLTPAYAATVTWILPTAYTDGTSIDPATIQSIVVEVYTGTSSTGPWSLAVTSSPGTTSATAPDPAAGQTLWYATRAVVAGVPSDYSASVSKTADPAPPPPPPTSVSPSAPTNLRIIP